jgi:integrase
MAGLPVDVGTAKSDAPAKPSLTVRQLGDKYVAYAKDYYSRNGRPTSEAGLIEKAIERLVKSFGDIPVTDFGPLLLSTYRDQLIDLGLSRTTVNSTTGRVRRMFRWGGSLEIVPSSVAGGLDLVGGLKLGRSTAREAVPVAPVPDDIIDATVAHLPDVVADMVRLQRLTGMRPGEVCSLRPCDVDRTGDDWTYRPASHKTAHYGKLRVVNLGPKSQAILLRYLARRPDAFCFSPRDSEAKRRSALHALRTTPMSCGNSPGTNVTMSPARRAGDRYAKDSYARAIARACELAFPAPDDLDDDARRKWNAANRWSPNQLRHTFATEVRRQFGIEAAQVMLGHSNLRTSEIYAERDQAKGSLVARQIG